MPNTDFPSASAQEAGLVPAFLLVLSAARPVSGENGHEPGGTAPRREFVRIGRIFLAQMLPFGDCVPCTNGL